MEDRSVGTRVRGMCPACRTHSLFVGTGGHLTCGLCDCPDPTLLDRVLADHGLLGILREIEARKPRDGEVGDG